MTVLLMMYLCLDATHANCQAIPVQGWSRPDTYGQCSAQVSELTDALTEKNRQRIYFRCDPQAGNAAQAQQANPQIIHQSFRF